MTTQQKIYIRTVDKKTFETILDLLKKNGVIMSKIKELEHPEKENTTLKYNFTCMEFDHSDSYYNRCSLIEIKIDGNSKHTIDYIKQLLSTVFTEKEFSIQSNSIRFHIKDYKFSNNNIDYNLNNTQNNLKYSVSILSFGRYNKNYTHKLLTKLKIQHFIFVEDKEYNLYRDKIDYTYCRLINCGDNPSELGYGSTPMRNYILNYFWERGENRIWMLDDNIQKYQRYNKGQKINNFDKNIFTSIEKHIQPLDNVGICSHNVGSTVKADGQRPVIVENGKHYSSMLLLTTPEFRFKWKYNEDIGISIDYILSGKLNLCFNHMLFIKNTSGKDKGGNTDTIYEGGSYQGYLTKYNYMYEKLKEMYELKILDLKSNFDDFIFRKDLKNKPHHSIIYNSIKINRRSVYPYNNDTIEYENLENFSYNKYYVNTE